MVEIIKSISIKIQRNETGKPKISESITIRDEIDFIDMLPDIYKRVIKLRNNGVSTTPQSIISPSKIETTDFKYRCGCGNGFNHTVDGNQPGKCPECALLR